MSHQVIIYFDRSKLEFYINLDSLETICSIFYSGKNNSINALKHSQKQQVKT